MGDCLEHPSSEKVRNLAKEDEDLIVRWTTQVESLSAIARRHREGVLSSRAEANARAALSALAADWSEVQPVESVRQRAARILRPRALRAGDALQPAAALLWAGEEPSPAEFVCLDENLRASALKKGFLVIP